MQLVLNEDQELLAKIAADFVREHSPVSRVRALRDAKDPVGFSRELWKQMAELGWLGIPYPESMGGAGLGFAELAVVLEALGRTLAPEPFLSTVLLGGQVLLRGGSDAQQAAWLPKLVKGEAILTLAYQEPRSRYDPRRVATRAEPDGTGLRLSGDKIQVLDGHVADALIVSARTAGDEADADGVGLFLVRAGAEGLEVERQLRIDSRNASLLRLRRVPAEAVAGGAELLERVVDLATAGLCAEMLGAMSEIFDVTLDYLRTREQFGVPIGSFQALKHRAAQLFIEIELARSAVMAATRALDEELDDASSLVSLAKARCSDAFVRVGNESIQMHGGIGMTDEYDMGFYLKRARVAELSFGDAAYHRDRWARRSGY
ncbi:MAG: acyl-CoA dehydrogenase family protein [Deltaproteobacteria bacterium]|nr:MAG: acyl-CoA dehydrogenase family protein [Deltaproteobacteria bacterium]